MAWEIENTVATDNKAVQPQWEIENSEPMTQSVMDAETQQMYNVPLGMDATDAKFAIDTQHGGKNKDSFFGKVWTGTQIAGESIEEVFQDFNRAVVEHAGQLVDSLVLDKGLRYQKRMKLVEDWENGDWSFFGDKEFSDEEKQNIIRRQKEKIAYIQNLRERTQKFFNKGAQIMRPDEKLNNADKFFIAASSGIVSTAEAAAVALATKNPTVAAAAIGTTYAALKDTEYFDKAVAAGESANDASTDATVAGAIEGGLEFVGDRLLLGIGKVKPIQQLGNKVINSSIAKTLKSKVGRSAIGKIASRHPQSIFGAAVKGAFTEGGEEFMQEGAGMLWENYNDVSSYSMDEILSQSLFAFAAGAVPGAGMGGIGTSIYNQKITKDNTAIKNILKENTPELTNEELQVVADNVQDALLQQGAAYDEQITNLLRKESEIDVMPDGLTAESLTADTRAMLKEKYGMSDEDINKTIDIAANYIDARNGFNETYNEYFDKMDVAGYDRAVTDNAARVLAARAVAIARAEGVSTEEVRKRWNLNLTRQSYEDFSRGVPVTDNYALRQRQIDDIMSVVPENWTSEQKKALRKGIAARARYGDLNKENFNAEMAKKWFETKGAEESVKAINKRVQTIMGVLNFKEEVENVKKSKRINPQNVNPFEALVDDRLYNKIAKIEKENKGDSLITFIIKRGGLKDVGGELKNMDAKKQRIGLINNKSGNSFDDIALAAWENGYFPSYTERPTINDLLEAISTELFGEKHYQYQDGNPFSMTEYVNSLAEQMDMLGVDYKGMSAEEAEAAYEKAAEEYSKNAKQYESETNANDVSIDDDFTLFQEAKDLTDKISKIDAEKLKYERKDINPELKGRENEKVKAVKINRFFAKRAESKDISLDDVVAALDTRVERNANGARVLKNSARGETVTLSKNALSKMFKSTSSRLGGNVGGILGKECIANIADIFDSAILVKTHNDEKHGSKNKIHRYANVIQSQKDSDSPAETYIVKITVKELSGGRKDLTDVEIEGNNDKNLAAYDLKVGKTNTAGNSLGNFAAGAKATVANNSGNDIIIDDLIDFVNTYIDEKISINGVDRWATNSNGNRIAKTAEGLRAFYEWFGDSKVVDKQGRPLVVYHGTNAEFDTFDKSKIGKGSYWGQMFYFGKGDEWIKQKGYSVSMPVYLQLKNPFVLKNKAGALQLEDILGKSFLPKKDIGVNDSWAKYVLGYRSKNPEFFSEKMQQAGYNGLIIPKYNIYGAFEPNQIKSVNNSGHFDVNNPNIYYQRSKNDNLTGDLFANPINNEAKPLPISVRKQVDDLFSYAEKQDGVTKELPLFSTVGESKKIEKTYQSSKQIVDAGDSLLGNLKRNAKVYTWEELEGMNDLLRRKYVTKTYIYPRLTIDDLRGRGIDGRAAALVEYVYNALNVKPAKNVNDTLANQKRFFDVIHRTMETVIKYAKAHKTDIEAWQTDMGFNYDLFHAVFPSDETNPRLVFSRNKEYNIEALVAGGNKFLSALMISGYDLAKLDTIAEDFDKQIKEKTTNKADVEQWQKHFMVVKRAYQDSWFVVDNNGKSISRDLSFATQEKAAEFAKKAYELVKPYLKGQGETVDFSGMRTGLPRRQNDQNVNPEALMETFGFRGVNFGNWTKQSERQEFLNLTYDSLLDMTEILGIPPKAIGLEGKLGLAFGAQGRAGAAGHFMPEFNEINLTRKDGAGSLAHEWWHALDYYFGDQSLGKDYSGHAVLELDKQGNLRSETYEAIRNLYQQISTADMSDKEVEDRYEAQVRRTQFMINNRASEIKNKFARAKNSEQINKFIDDMVAQGKNYDATKDEKYLSDFQDMVEERRRTAELAGLFFDLQYRLRQLVKLDDNTSSWRKVSKYYDTAVKLNRVTKKKNGYWTQRTELGARAFASYINDKVASNGWYNFFLAGHAKAGILDEYSYLEALIDAEKTGKKADINNYMLPIYPADEMERANIDAAFDRLFKTIEVDPENNYRLYQKTTRDGASPRGAFVERGDENIIFAFENADASTVIHELGHFFLHDMQKFADNPKTAEQLAEIYKYLGAENGTLTREQEEKFADTFEVYLLDGRAPNQILKGAFARFKKWISSLWYEVKRLSGIKVTDEVRSTFDEMLGGKGLDFAMQASTLKMGQMLERGNISQWQTNRAMQMLYEGKMSKADMQNLIQKLRNGMKNKEFVEALKEFENKPAKSNREMLTEWDYTVLRNQLDGLNFNRDKVKARVEKLLKWSEPRTNGGKLVGRFPSKGLNDAFARYRELATMNKDEAKQKLQENVDLIEEQMKSGGDVDIEQLIFENRLLSYNLGKISNNELLKLYDGLAESYNMGRLTDKITGDAKRERKKQMIERAKNVLTNYGAINPNIESSEIKKRLARFGLTQQSWGGLLDTLSMNDKRSQTGKSALSDDLDMFEAEQKKYAGIAADSELISQKLEKFLSGTMNNAQSVTHYMNTELDKKIVIEWSGLIDPKERNPKYQKWQPFKRTFTKDQLIDIYMKSLDDDTREIMINDPVNQYNKAFLNKVKDELTTDDLAVADAIFEFYNENYERFNAFYEEHFGMSLPKSKYYTPRAMSVDGVTIDDKTTHGYASFSGAKKRVAVAGTGVINIQGAFRALNKYINQQNHYMGYMDKLTDINAVLANKDVKGIINSLFGAEMNKRIAYEIDNLANNGNDKVDVWGKRWNKVRANYAKSVLAVKPSLAIKQLTSFPAYWENVSTKDFIAGVADFFAHPKEAMRTLGGTTLMKTRDTDIIRDFDQMSKSNLFAKMKKAKGKIKWNDLLMFNIKFGDRGAIYMGGWALYKSELNKNLKAGMSEKEAKTKALEAFERITDETQQSGRLSQQSYMQSNSALRAFTMFTSSQNQYLRKEINAIRGLATGRMSKAKVAKTIFIYHVLLPVFFQVVSDGFRWDKDNDLRAAVLGSLNGWFILNKVLENVYNWITDNSNMFATRMSVRDLVPFWGSIEDLKNDLLKFADDEMDLEDVLDVIKPIGEVTGLPLKYAKDVVENAGEYADEGEYGKELLLWLGWSPYSLRDSDDE